MAEVEATLSRLSSHNSVKGVLILSSTSGKVIRYTGEMLQDDTNDSKRKLEAHDDDDEDGSGATATALDGAESAGHVSENAKRYARVVKNMVDSAKDGAASLDTEDSVRFLRIRTKRHELMITPEEKYTLVVFHDPAPA